MTGRVYIIGAGPGDPSLITLRALRALRSAHVVLYDRLANDALLAYAPDAETIFVGKTPGRPSLSQDDINALLAQKACEGKTVVRLKGGDPLLFGRGAEEADFLVAQGIDFEIIPGVTAALAASSFTGVPLTDRRDSSLVTFVTAREGDSSSPGVDYGALARTGGTIVLYMGRGNLREVCARLVDGGLDEKTPVLVVQNASLPVQRTVAGTLSDVSRKADDAKLAPPCITIIGRVAGRYPALAWFERLPLFGASVLLTRPEPQQQSLAAALAALGADVIRLPAIEIVPSPPEDLRRGLDSLVRADWLVFTSTNGVATFFDGLARENLDARALASLKVAAIGPATAAALSARSFCADLVPHTFTGDSLLDSLLDASAENDRFLLWRAAAARRTLADGLREKGRGVIEVAAYDTRRPADSDSSLVKRIAAAPPSALLFSSASTAENFVQILGPDQAVQIASASKVVSIGPVTTDALKKLGMPPDLEADPHTAHGLLCATLDVLYAGVLPEWLDLTVTQPRDEFD